MFDEVINDVAHLFDNLESCNALNVDLVNNLEK